MFGSLFSAIGKVFKPVTNVVSRVGSAIFGVGSAVSTAGAATGAASLGQGGLNSFLGGGTLGNVLGGAIRQAGFGALLGAGVGALTGTGAGRGALAGGLAGAVTGGLSGFRQPATAAATTPASTPTGMAPTGTTQPIARPRGLGTATFISPAATQPSTVVTPQAPPRRGLGTMFTNLFQGEQGGAILRGVGEGLLTGLALREQEAARDRRDQQVRDSYSVDPRVLHKPLTRRGNGNAEPGRSRYVQFNPATGLIE